VPERANVVLRTHHAEHGGPVFGRPLSVTYQRNGADHVSGEYGRELVDRFGKVNSDDVARPGAHRPYRPRSRMDATRERGIRVGMPGRTQGDPIRALGCVREHIPGYRHMS
jgi:hypothetical protein